MTELIKQTQLDRDHAALANPTSATQVIGIADRSNRLQKALRGLAGHEEQYYKAFEVWIEACGILGRELKVMEKAKGGGANQYGNFGAVPDGNSTKMTLTDIGITRKQSSEWQKIAMVPDIDIKNYIERQREEERATTKSDILAMAQNYITAEEQAKERSLEFTRTILNFANEAKTLIMFLERYSTAREGIPPEFQEALDKCLEVIDQLKRVTL